MKTLPFILFGNIVNFVKGEIVEELFEGFKTRKTIYEVNSAVFSAAGKDGQLVDVLESFFPVDERRFRSRNLEAVRNLGNLVDEKIDMKFDFAEGKTWKSLSCRNLQEVTFSLGDFCSFDDDFHVEVRRNGDLNIYDGKNDVCGGSNSRRLQLVSEDKTCLISVEEGKVYGALTLNSTRNSLEKGNLIHFESKKCEQADSGVCLQILHADEILNRFNFTGDEVHRKLQSEEDLSPFYLERASSDCYEGIDSELPNKMFYGFVTTTLFSSEHGNGNGDILRYIELIVSAINLVYIQQLNFRVVVSYVTILKQDPNGGGNGIWADDNFDSFNSGSCSVSLTRHEAFGDAAPQRLVGTWVLLNGQSCSGSAGLGDMPGICLTSGRPGATSVRSFDDFNAYVLMHEVGHNFGSDHTVNGIMVASGVNTLDDEFQFSGSSITQICDTITDKLRFCQRTDIDGLRAVEMNPSSSSGGEFRSGVIDEECQCDPQNECCRADCSFADASVVCETEVHHGYCRNGACEPSGDTCEARVSGSDFCGVFEDNPCMGRCSQDEVCQTGFLFQIAIKAGSKCANGTHDGICLNDVCNFYAETPEIVTTTGNNVDNDPGGLSTGASIFISFLVVGSVVGIGFAKVRRDSALRQQQGAANGKRNDYNRGQGQAATRFWNSSTGPLVSTRQTLPSKQYMQSKVIQGSRAMALGAQVVYHKAYGSLKKSDNTPATTSKPEPRVIQKPPTPVAETPPTSTERVRNAFYTGGQTLKASSLSAYTWAKNYRNSGTTSNAEEEIVQCPPPSERDQEPARSKVGLKTFTAFNSLRQKANSLRNKPDAVSSTEQVSSPEPRQKKKRGRSALRDSTPNSPVAATETSKAETVRSGISKVGGYATSGQKYLTNKWNTRKSKETLVDTTPTLQKTNKRPIARNSLANNSNANKAKPKGKSSTKTIKTQKAKVREKPKNKKSVPKERVRTPKKMPTPRKMQLNWSAFQQNSGTVQVVSESSADEAPLPRKKHPTKRKSQKPKARVTSRKFGAVNDTNPRFSQIKGKTPKKKSSKKSLRRGLSADESPPINATAGKSVKDLISRYNKRDI
eukprot:augustus_masked-scaffold_2-processed-gene-7.10-mRNA-1 protein AED:1.00 eAED:1.00 QI:0/-1/0/0/-1/1/1/0/1081